MISNRDGRVRQQIRISDALSSRSSTLTRTQQTRQVGPYYATWVKLAPPMSENVT